MLDMPMKNDAKASERTGHISHQMGNQQQETKPDRCILYFAYTSCISVTQGYQVSLSIYLCIPPSTPFLPPLPLSRLPLPSVALSLVLTVVSGIHNGDQAPACLHP